MAILANTIGLGSLDDLILGLLYFDGSTWTQKLSNTSFALYGVGGTDANNVYAAGANGTLLRFDGTNWTKQDSGTTNTLLSVLSVGSDVYVSGYAGTVLKRLSR